MQRQSVDVVERIDWKGCSKKSRKPDWTLVLKQTILTGYPGQSNFHRASPHQLTSSSGHKNPQPPILRGDSKLEYDCER